MKDDRLYWMWLSHRCGRGSTTAVSLIRRVNEASTVYKASPESLSELDVFIPKKTLTRLADKSLDEEQEIISWCDRNGVTVLTPRDERYPTNLLSLSDAPMVLYAVGCIDGLATDFHCAVVGTRTMTEYGKSAAYSLGRDLASGGATLVSGLALGVDGMAMAGALDVGGRCVAVLGCGIDIVYPKEHEALLHRVLENGAVLTEYAPGTSPSGSHFPVRNRIISGISSAVCVVEGNMKSGSLITARHAVYQGRALFAVPGNVGEEASTGTNFLISEGAKPLLSAETVLSEFRFLYPHSLLEESQNGIFNIYSDSAEKAAEKMSIGRKEKKKKQKAQSEAQKALPAHSSEKRERTKRKNPFPDIDENKRKPTVKSTDISDLGPNELCVLNYMKDDVPILADELIGCGLSLSQILVALTMLELAGAVEAGAGGFYLKRGADSICEPEYITEDDNGM